MSVYRLEVDVILDGKFLNVTLAFNQNKAEITLKSKTSLSLIGKLDLFKMFCNDLASYEMISEFPNYIGNNISFPITWEGISFEVYVNTDAEIKIISEDLSETQKRIVFREFYKNLTF